MTKGKKSWLKVEKVAFISFLTGILSLSAFLLAGKYFTDDKGIIFIFVDIAVGLISFGVFGVSMLIIMWRTLRAWLIVIILFLMLIPVGLGGYLYANVKNLPTPTPVVVKTLTPTAAPVAQRPNFTGQELLMAVNHHRNINGAPELPLDERLCNNLAQRYFDIAAGLEEGVAHAKFNEWVNNNVGGNILVTEIFTGPVRTPQEAIDSWMGSPGHRVALLDASHTGICAYAADGYAVVEFSKPL